MSDQPGRRSGEYGAASSLDLDEFIKQVTKWSEEKIGELELNHKPAIFNAMLQYITSGSELWPTPAELQPGLFPTFSGYKLMNEQHGMCLLGRWISKHPTTTKIAQSHTNLRQLSTTFIVQLAYIHKDNMPLYDVEHVCSLSEEKMMKLAQAITDCHATRFVTPKFFINVRFTDVSAQVVFRGGLRQKYNRIILRTRASNQRSTDLYNEHCRDVMKLWDEIIGNEEDRSLRTVWVMGALTTAVEAGIERPKARTRRVPWIPYQLTICRLAKRLNG